MRLLVVVAVVLLVTSELCEAGRRRGKGRRKYRDGRMQKHEEEDHEPLWRRRIPRWQDYMNRWLRRVKTKDYGFGLDLGNEDFKFNFNFGWGNKPWWQGPNVCRTQTEEHTNTTEAGAGVIARHFSYHSHVCDETESAYKCTTTSRVMDKKIVKKEVYECCKGYARKENEHGCPREQKLENLVDAAKSLGLHEFIRATDSVSMTEELKEGNFTVFAPVDKAFAGLQNALPEIGLVLPNDMDSKVVMVSKPVTELIVKDMQNLLLGHLAVGLYRSSNLHDEQLVETGSPYKSKIRINFYDTPKKLMTANCVPIVSTDNVATNGIIHTIESLLQPVTGTIVDVISKSPQLGFLKTALARVDMVQTYRQDGQFTIFAPSDTAFEKMDKTTREKLLKGDSKCLKKVLDNHVLPNVICSSIINGKTKSKNLLGKYTTMTRDENDKLFVGKAQVIEKDIMTSNGVIHVIDEVLVPEDALKVTDHIEKQGATKFLGLLRQAKMLGDIQKTDNITVFVPTNQALENLPASISQKINSDTAYLKEVLQFHVVPEEVDNSRFYNNYHLDTMLGERTIRINEYSLFPYHGQWTQTAQCSRIQKANIPSCNGVINIIDKVMIPPKGNVVDILGMDKKFSEMVRLIKMSGIADSLQEEGPFTVFAPTNDAFKELGSRTVKMLTENMDELRTVLKNHLAKDALCCAGIFKSGWYGSPRLRTLGGQTFHLERSEDDQIKIGPAEVTTCDLSGTNGVVHVIDRVLVEGERTDFLGRILRGWRRRHRYRHKDPWSWL